MINDALGDLAVEPDWGDDGNRAASIDCGDESRTEVEPNGWDEMPEDGSSRPFTMLGTTCPTAVIDGIILDEEVIDLGVIEMGTALNVTVTRDAGSPIYPFFALIPGDDVDSYATDGPAMLEVDSASKTWVIEVTGQYSIVVYDGRNESSFVYDEDATIPEADQCCHGGEGFTYTVTVEEVDLEATEDTLAMGDTPGTLTDGLVRVYPFEVSSGVEYAIRYIADDNYRLDPYLVLYDPATGALLGANDDEDYYSDNIDSLVTWTASEDMTIYVGAGYFGTWFFPSSPPTYTIRIE